MVEFDITIHPKQRQAYIPKEIVVALGHKLKARPDRYAVLMYPEGVDPALVIKSVEILLQDLKLGLEAAPEAKTIDQGELKENERENCEVKRNIREFRSTCRIPRKAIRS